MNPIAKLQKWMDSPSGQVFMNYAYSWGAAVVVLGTLFKLTHVPGANLMMFIGMGTEVFVFIISGFEKTYEKYAQPEGEVSPQQPRIVVAGGVPAAEGEDVPETIVLGAAVAASAGGSASVSAGAVAPEALAAGTGLSAAAANLAAAGQAAAEAQLALSQLKGGQGVNPDSIRATDPADIEEAVTSYAEELKALTEVLGRVREQAARMSTDSEEMENLNRTLTGIATVYELQLRNISKQVSTIEQIDEQTRRMAQQIEELNNVYARMIQALTVNMNVRPAQNQQS